MPGTWGSMAALPLIYYIEAWPPSWRLAFWILFTLAGVWASKVIDELMQTGDNQIIVIDEVSGMGIATWTCAAEPVTLLAAFIAFRFFDMIKLPPVRYLDAWSKNASKHGSPWAGAWGVMGDDLIAGVQALVVVLGLQAAALIS